MVMLLLPITLLIALSVAAVVVFLFGRPIESILKRVVPVDLSSAWVKYLKFAIYVVGIGGGVRVWAFEKYLMPVDPYGAAVPLTSERWMLEVYETIIGALQSTVMVLLVFFVFALMAVVIGRIFETRTTKADSQTWPAPENSERETARRLT